MSLKKHIFHIICYNLPSNSNIVDLQSGAICFEFQTESSYGDWSVAVVNTGLIP
jgi:hypothetical protein